MFEELNLQDERFSSNFARKNSEVMSAISNLDVMQIKASLHRLQTIVEEQDVANLVLLLKELIPDYNPGAELLKTAFSAKEKQAVPVKVPVLSIQTKTPTGAKLTQAALMN